MIRHHGSSVAALAALLLSSACQGSGFEPGVSVEEPERFDHVETTESDPAPETPAAPQLPKTEATLEQDLRATEELARRTALADAPRRSAGDLFVVGFTPLELADAWSLTDGTPLAEAVRDAFLSHEVVRVADDERVARAFETAQGNDGRVFVPVDVLVFPVVEPGDEGLTLGAEVRSAYTDEPTFVESHGADADTAFTTFRDELERVLLDVVGPDLPRDADHLRREEHLEAADRRALELRRRAAMR